MKVSESSSTGICPPASPATSATPPPDRVAAPAAARPQRFGLDGPSRIFDPRIHAYRKDVADVALAGLLFAPHYARPERCRIAVDAAMLRAGPSVTAPAVSQLLRGEGFAALDVAGGWAWGKCLHDDYVGYLPAAALGPVEPVAWRVAVPSALLFTAPDIKAPVRGTCSFGTLLGGEASGAFVDTPAGFVHRRHLAVPGEVVADVAAVAESLIGLPYLWGGRGGGGIDCSGLAQVALALGGIPVPRDSDQQRAVVGTALPDEAPLRRGDLVFFPGHVGIMADGTRLIHATAHWMRVVVEPLADVVTRLMPDHPQPILARRRP